MKVKIKRVRGGSMGDQRNYGLVTGSIWNYEDKPSTNNVTTTMSPTDREDATIEAERGETIVGDLDNDGQLEHVVVGGKRHSEGGTPLNVPDGSFVFSDYNGLLIKNKEMLANVFNYKSGKSATPAKVAKRYEINRYKDILNDPNADFLDQKTAQLMIDNNLKKLGQLALVQESMKGFPDGIPNIALPLFGSDQPAPKQQVMKKGGLVKAQFGQTVRDPRLQFSPAASSPVKYMQSKVGKAAGASPRVAYRNEDDTIYETQDPTMWGDFALAAGSPFATLMSTGDRTGNWRSYVQEHQDNPVDYALNTVAAAYALAPQYFASNPALLQTVSRTPQYAAAAYDFLVNPYGGMRKEYGGQYMQGGGEETPYWKQALIGAAVASGVVPAVSAIIDYAIKPAAQGASWLWEHENAKKVTTRKKSPTTGKYRNVTRTVKTPAGIYPTLKNVPKSVYKKLLTAGAGALLLPPLYNSLFGEEEVTGPVVGPGGSGLVTPEQQKQQQDSFMRAAQQMWEQPATTPGAASSQANKLAEEEQARKMAQMQAQAAAARKQTRQSTRTTPASSPATTVGRVLSQQELDSLRGIPKKNQYGGIMRLGGNPVYRYQSAGEYTAYQPSSSVLSNDEWEVIPSKQLIDFTFGTQHFDPATGTYFVTDPRTKQKVTVDLDDWYDRAIITEQETGIPYLSGYPGGIDQFKKDVISRDPATREKATGYAQTNYDLLREKINMPEYYYGTPGKDPYAEDKKFGIYTSMQQGFRKKKKPSAPATPAAPAAPVAEKEEEEFEYNTPAFQGSTRPRSVGWWKGDIAGMMGVAGQQIPDYLLTSSVLQPSLMSPAYTEFDPSAITGAYQAYLQNVGTGPQGKGAALSATGATGKTLEALNRERQANRATNVDVFLKTAAANQQALNQANLYNAEERKAYIDRYNTILNATTQASNKKLADFTEKYTKGLKNIMNLNAVNAMLPYQYSDWEGTSVNPTLTSIYDEPITGMGSGVSGGGYDAIYQAVYTRLTNAGVDPKEAALEASRAAARMASGKGGSGYGTSGAASSIYDFLD